MNIRGLTIIPLTSPYALPNTTAKDHDNGVRNCVWLRVDSDEGLTGWGEAYCGCYATEVTVSALGRLTRSLVGRCAVDPVPVMEELRFENRYWAMRGVGAQCTSAVEAALWDLAAQVRQFPLWQLLGDGKSRPVLAYASAGVSSLPPDAIRREVEGYVRDGFLAYKMRCAGSMTDQSDRLSIDEKRVAAAREVLGRDRMLFVDVAVPQKPIKWDRARAETYIRMLEAYNVRFLEEPAMTYDLAMYRDLQAFGRVPIAGGESFCAPDEFEPFFAARGYGVAQPDAAVVGGPASCVEVMRRARACATPVALHAWSAGVGLAQNLHAGCSIDGVLTMECPIAIHPVATEPVRDIWHFKDGYLQPPSKPGLGVTITTTLLQENAYRPGMERNY